MYIIDVSQSVEHDHPHAYDFLRSDLTNIAAFFRKCSSGSVRVLGLRRAFEFVTWGSVGEAKFEPSAAAADDETAREAEKRRWEDVEWERCLGDWLEGGAGGAEEDDEDDEAEADAVEEGEVELVEEFKSTAITPESTRAQPVASMSKAFSSASNGGKHANKSKRAPHFSAALPTDKRDLDDAQDDLIFKSTYIPRSLAEVYDPERDVDAVNRGEGTALEYVRTGGVGIVGVGDAIDEEAGSASDSGSDDDEASGSESDSDVEGADKPPKPLRGHRNEDRDVKKARKKAAKEEAAEKRKTKMPKKVKKRKINQGKHDR
jgi:RIO kinase 1